MGNWTDRIKDLRLTLKWAPPVGVALLRILYKTVQVVHEDKGKVEALWEQGDNIICAFWHGRLLMMPFLCPGKAAAILISQHRDGEYISRMAERLGFAVIRGSATRGGLKAFRQMISALKNGFNMAITPDGPKGPPERVKWGVIELAKLTGAPIVPVTFGASKRRVLKSWDAFLIPYPFSRGVFIWGDPLWVRADASKAERIGAQELLEERLRAITEKADSYFDVPPL
ncbi:MAG: lysophospholipid acyltransferase family protein [candidate division NC10 bacterium]|nr:lysophospholipid acyltransferase family protein [candidate division NC10 bacterium]